MSREIKFRVYDKKLDQYVVWGPHIPFDSDEYNIEQYSGYKDMNGKEIYENDVLLIKWIPIKVEFKEGGFMLGPLMLNDHAYDKGRYVDYIPNATVVDFNKIK